MALLIQCIVACILFTLLILLPQFRNPVSQIASYPPAIQARVASLPQYQGNLQSTRKKGIAKKIVGTFIVMFVLAALAYFSGKRTFPAAFLHVFILFFVVNMYDLLVLDLLVFRHSKKVIIPGTEDMVAYYKDPMHHIKGAAKGTLIGMIVATLSAGLVVLMRIMGM